MSIATAILADAPATYWQLNEASGTTATDFTSGNTHPGTYSGTFTLAQAGPEPGTNAVRMLSNGLVATTITTAVTAKPYSCEIWFARVAQPGSNAALVENWAASMGAGICFQQSGSATTFNVLRQGVGFSSIFGSVNDTLWHHVVFCLSAGDVATGYVDGVQLLNQSGQTSGAITSSGRFQAAGNATQDFYIAHAALYSVVLSSAQVTTHYNAKSTVAVPTERRIGSLGATIDIQVGAAPAQTPRTFVHWR